MQPGFIPQAIAFVVADLEHIERDVVDPGVNVGAENVDFDGGKRAGNPRQETEPVPGTDGHFGDMTFWDLPPGHGPARCCRWGRWRGG